MDAISRVLRDAQLEATLERRCQLSAGTEMPVASPGIRRVPFHILLEGECLLIVNETELQLTAGDVVVVPSSAPHRIITTGAGSLMGVTETAGRSFASTRSISGGPPIIDLFCGHYSVGPGTGAILFQSLPDPIRVSFGVAGVGAEFLEGLSKLMRGEAGNEGQGTSAILSALSTVLLAMVLRTSAGAGTDARLWTAAADPGIARAISGVIDDPGAKWNLDQVADAALMSRATFIRRFQRETGMTFGDFVARTRISAATVLLTTTRSSVADIAARVGYQSESAFGRIFRRTLGTTPAVFRRRVG
jgi:AraC family transcriptional activator of mtrCDE